MKRKTSQAFTLVEMLTVMLIIAIISGLIVGVATFANKKAAIQKTQGEIEAMASAIANYKADNGTVPRETGVTEQDLTNPGGAPPIDPRSNGNPTSTAYQNASVFLYQQLSGDGDLDGKPDSGAKVYFEFKPGMLGGISGGTGSGATGTVKYLQDPYGLSYGYSTAGAASEDAYQKLAAAAAPTSTGVGNDLKVTEPDRSKITPYGYNASFDLWSTAGQQIDPPTDLVRQKWVKNW